MSETAPKIIVGCGPTAVGKSSVFRTALEKRPDIKLAVSYTTRNQRPGEIDGVHYRFVSWIHFLWLLLTKNIFEFSVHPRANIHGQLYGTPTKELNVSRSSHLYLEVNLDGVRAIKKLRPDAHVIFITAPIDILRKRIIERGCGTSGKKLEDRISFAEEEMREGPKLADFVLMNDGTFEDAVAELSEHLNRIAPPLKS